MGQGEPCGVVARVNKRTHESMEEAEYSKYGLTSGRIVAGLKMERLCCGIIATGWPTWGFAAKDKGWHVVVVITKSNQRHKPIKKMFPGTLVVSYDESENRFAIATKIQLWFRDVDPPS
jgi:hypothetical protein